MRRALATLMAVMLLLLGGPVYVLGSGEVDLDATWRTGSRDPTGLAPDPATASEAVVQVYGARVLRWRGAFGIHTWIAVKPENAPRYTVYEIIGWRALRGGSALVIGDRAPDGRWFGQEPELLADLRGPEAQRLIPRIDAAARAYPYAEWYRIWPGPNSNTFVAHVARAVPELGVDLPPTAIGKDYLGHDTLFAPAPSGTGYQASLFGALGLLVAVEEGVEVNLLGFTLGIDPLDLGVKLPGVGRIALLD